MLPFSPNEVALDQPMIVEASAGTGKTFAITHLVLRLLLEEGLRLPEILVVTFTEAATAELRERVRARLLLAQAHLEGRHDGAVEPLLAAVLARAALQAEAEAPARILRRALEDIDQSAIFTIHGFCYRVLRDYAVDSGVPLDAELVVDTSAIRDEVVHDFWALELAQADKQHVHILRRHGLTPAGCRQLVMTATRSPEMALAAPQHTDVAPPDARPFVAAVDAAKVLWRSAPIAQLLANARDDGILSGNKYRKASVPVWCDKLNEFFVSPPPYPALSTAFDKFCNDGLLAGCRKGRHAEVPRHSFFDACDAIREAVRAYDAAAEPVTSDFRRRLVAYAREQLPRRKLAQGILSFDDLLTRLATALSPPTGDGLAGMVRRRYRVALIDEFQDTDPIQYGIFRSIWARGGLYLIGDPKQAIYSFRGADVFAYIAAAKAVAETRRFTMTTNWRSDELLVAGVNALFSASKAPFVLPDIGFHPVQAREDALAKLSPLPPGEEAPLHFRFVVTDEQDEPLTKNDLAPLVAADVARLLGSEATIEGRPIGPADVAILTRSNIEAFAAKEALSAVGVRAVVLGDQSVLEPNQPDSLMFQRVLQAALEPSRSGLLRAALSSRWFGVSAADLAAMEDDEDVRAAALWQRWVDCFRRYKQLWVDRGFIQMVRALLSDNQVYERLLGEADGERRMTNLLHLVELLHRASVEEHLGPLGLLNWLRAQRALAKERSRPEAMQIRLESDDTAVKITTIHKSKGLQYPVVFCPFLTSTVVRRCKVGETTFHDPEAGGALTMLLSAEVAAEGSATLEQIEREQLAEGVRLLYVAVTRAQHRCVLYWGKLGGYEGSALGYLLAGDQAFASGGYSNMRASLKALDEADMWDRLSQLQIQHPAAIGISAVTSLVAAEVPASPSQAGVPLRRHRIVQPIEHWSRTASFTELSSYRHRANSGVDPHDWDAAVARVATSKPTAEPQPAPAGPAATLAAFPRGARAGICLHALLEHWDFGEERADVAAAHVRVILPKFGFDPDTWSDEVGQALIAICHTPLSAEEGGLRLCDVSKEERLDEFEFLFPVAQAAARSAGEPAPQLGLFAHVGDAGVAQPSRLTPSSLASVLRLYPSAALSGDYAERVRQLSFLPLKGFLKGFVDLIFCHDNRWYVADYKSNFLGEQLSDYGPEPLSSAMASGHYYLQYHLYTVALHRFLKRRLSGYRYASHFGGVYYLFLRGMAPATGARYGTFFERPPAERIAALSQLLEQPSTADGKKKPRRRPRRRAPKS